MIPIVLALSQVRGVLALPCSRGFSWMMPQQRSALLWHHPKPCGSAAGALPQGASTRWPPQSNTLYERTEGRPILIGLAIDVLNNRILTIKDLIEIPQNEFEASLVPQINQLENPLNWVFLFMAHVYHRFNMSIFAPVLPTIMSKKSSLHLMTSRSRL